jgi:hypothetical protein
MALQNEAWFIHAVSENVTQLAQQKTAVVTGSCRTKEGVVGKTWPFNRIGSEDMIQITTRDGTTQYANPPQTKRRAVLLDFGLAVLIDDFDEIKTLTNPMSEHAQIMGYALARKRDALCLSVDGLVAAGTAGAGSGGFLGKVTTVDEAGETTSLTDLPSAQQIVHGSTNLTMAKIRSAKLLMDNADVEPEDRYIFASPGGVSKMLTDATVTSSDYGTIKRLIDGGFGMDETWMGFKWRMSTRLFKAGNIRQCIAVQKMGVGLALGLVKGVEMSKNPERWNNDQAIIKLSGGAARIDDARVVQIDIDEST